MYVNIKSDIKAVGKQIRSDCLHLLISKLSLSMHAENTPSYYAGWPLSINSTSNSHNMQPRKNQKLLDESSAVTGG